MSLSHCWLALRPHHIRRHWVDSNRDAGSMGWPGWEPREEDTSYIMDGVGHHLSMPVIVVGVSGYVVVSVDVSRCHIALFMVRCCLSVANLVALHCATIEWWK
jgi:hypothetical protein